MADRYDAVRYPGHAFPQTHPDRRRGARDALRPRRGRARGLQACSRSAAATAATCSAWRSRCPEATFAGFDIVRAGDRVARGHAHDSSSSRTCASRRSGSRTSRPRRRASTTSSPMASSRGCPTRCASGCSRSAAHVLSERGVAFVSYNALPGYRLRQTLRELLALELEGIEDPALRIAGARRLLALLERRERARDPDRRRGRRAERALGRAAVSRRARGGQRGVLVLRVRRARRGPRPAVPRGGRPARDADRHAAARHPRHAAGRRAAPRAGARLPQAAPLSPDAALPRRGAARSRSDRGARRAVVGGIARAGRRRRRAAPRARDVRGSRRSADLKRRRAGRRGARAPRPRLARGGERRRAARRRGLPGRTALRCATRSCRARCAGSSGCMPIRPRSARGRASARGQARSRDCRPVAASRSRRCATPASASRTSSTAGC